MEGKVITMSNEAKVLGGISLLTIIIVILAALSFGGQSSPQKENIEPIDQKILVRDDSYKIESPGATITVVEFLDFECEACEAAYPTVEQIRKDYKGKINFVVRYFPLHKNSVLAAKAAESAGEQGKFWEMYSKLFENQKEWGEKTEPQTELFTKYAEDLELDVDKFKEGLESKAFEAKVNRDKEDGIKAGVQGTPTFFINGVLAGNVLSYEEFKSKIDTELNK